MKNSDLKSGMIVETQEEKLYLVVGDKLIGEDGYLNLASYHDDLKHTLFRDFDIIKVYNYKLGRSFSRLLDDDNLELIWERKDIKLTNKEVEILKALRTLSYDFLVRDENGELYACKEKPERQLYYWYKDELTRIDKDLFTFIKWEDEEPTNIDELLKELEK